MTQAWFLETLDNVSHNGTYIEHIYLIWAFRLTRWAFSISMLWCPSTISKNDKVHGESQRRGHNHLEVIGNRQCHKLWHWATHKPLHSSWAWAWRLNQNLHGLRLGFICLPKVIVRYIYQLSTKENDDKCVSLTYCPLYRIYRQSLAALLPGFATFFNIDIFLKAFTCVLKIVSNCDNFQFGFTFLKYFSI